MAALSLWFSGFLKKVDDGRGWTTGSGSPLPVEVRSGSAAHASAAVAILKTSTRFFQFFIDEADALF
ncbi:MAG: hypothetical protein ACKVP7_26195 [Hyphomicrobiaceae bacterium]